jgi:CHASE3 domain sensor protein
MTATREPGDASGQPLAGSFLQKLKARHLFLVGIAIPALLLILVDGLQWQSTRDFSTARDWATHTRTVLFELESFLASVNDAETGQRGYLLTHRDSYLEPYTQAVADIPQQLRNLRQMMADDPGQLKNLDLLEPLVKAKLDELGETVAEEQKKDHTDAINTVLTDFGQQKMTEIRKLLGNMSAVEDGLLQQRETAYLELSRRNAWLSALAIVIGLGFIVVIFYLLRRMDRMQEMIKICAWSKLIEYEGEWLTIEQYLTKRHHAYITHGLAPNEAEKMLQIINETTG